MRLKQIVQMFGDVSKWKMIVLRRVPHTLISWRFLLPCGGAVQLHKRVFLEAWPQLPRWCYGSIVFYSLCSWFGFWVWYFMLVCLRRQAKRLKVEAGVPVSKQVCALLHMATRGMPGPCYYAFQLHRYPSDDWWRFVCEHELPHWHLVLGGRPSPESQRILSDKQRFAEHMDRRGIPVVKPRLVWAKGSVPDWRNIGEDSFLKPIDGSRSRGCFIFYTPYALRNSSTREPLLCGDGKRFVGPEAIAEQLRQMTAAFTYLVQPLLCDHPDLDELLACVNVPASGSACTIRIVTASYAGKVEPLFAQFEMRSERYKCWKMAEISLADGSLTLDVRQLRDDCFHSGDGLSVHEGSLMSAFLPHWSALVDVVCRAHRSIADVRTVGWDLIITERGPVLLEGNINWGVAGHQQVTASPMLSDRLMKVYSASI